MAVTLESLSAQVDALTKLVAQLLAQLLEREAAPAALPLASEVPPGHVAVRPTGVHGQGKVRYWPDPQTLLNYEGKPVETLGGYALQANAKGCRFFDFASQAGLIMMGLPWQPAGPAQYPEALDRVAFPDDWKTQKELDYDAALKERDRAIFKGRDGFISAPVTVADHAAEAGAVATPSGLVTEVPVE